MFMRISSTIFVVLLLFAEISPALQSPVLSTNQSQQADSGKNQTTADATIKPLTVLYTGKLFGYLRVDGCEGLMDGKTPENLINPESCKNPDSKIPRDAKEQVNCFIRSLNDERKSGSGALLVGMGDNFAPRLEAHMELGPDDRWWKPRSKNPETSDLKKDPVGCFLRVAKYDAVVPGAEDFNLGPERLRNIAEFLHTSSPAVPMLGANIVLNVHFKKPGDPIPDDQKKLEFDTFQSQQRFQPQSTEPFLPSLRYIEFKVALLVNECTPEEQDETQSENRKNAEKCKPKPKPAPGVDQLLKDAGVTSIQGSGIFEQLVSESIVSHKPATMLCGPYGDLDSLTSKPGANAIKTDKSTCAAAGTIEIFNTKPPSEASSPWEKFTEVIASNLDKCSAELKTYQASKFTNIAEARQLQVNAQKRCKEVSQYLKGDSIDLASPVVPSVQLRWSIDQTVLDCPAKPAKMMRQDKPAEDCAAAASTNGITARNFVPDKSYRFCIASDESAKRLYCQRLPIRRPLLQDRYVYLRDRELVIFGVVDQDLRDQISDNEGSWKEDPEHGRKVEIETVDPLAALVQAEDAFRKEWPDFQGKKVLLAQMDVHRAEELAAHLEPRYSVDLTIARADQNHSTPPLKLSLAKDDKQKQAALVPTFISDTKDLINPLAKAILEEKDGNVTLSTSNLSKNKLTSLPPETGVEFSGLTCASEKEETDLLKKSLADTTGRTKAPRMLVRLRCAAKEYLSRIAEKEGVFPRNTHSVSLSKKVSSSSEFVDTALQIMRKKSNADLAMLEKREIYGIVESDNSAPVEGGNAAPAAGQDVGNPDKNDPKYLRKFLDRIFWEDSTVQKLVVTGATLKKVLKQSDAYSAQEQSTTEKVEIFGRPLNVSGLQPGTSKDEYLINGKLLDDATEYSIATSERMLTGSSDYPDLRKDLAGKTVEIDSSDGAAFISFLVCSELSSSGHLRQADGELPQCAPGPEQTACAGQNPKKCQEEVAHDYMRPAKTIFAARPLCNPAVGTAGQPGWCTAYSADMLDPSKGIDYLARVKASFWLPRLVNNPLDISRKKLRSFVEGAEVADQFQRTRRLSISELSVALSGSHPDENAQQISSLFSSAILSTASQARSSSVDVKNTSRYYVTHYVLHGQGLDLYASDTAAFSSVDQAQTGPFPNKVTLNSNQWSAVPAGLSWSFSSEWKKIFGRKADRLFPDVNLIFEPSRFTGQFTPTDNFLTVQQSQGSGGTCNGTVTSGICNFSVDVEQQRTLSWSPRLGIRFENTDSYFELGGQGSRDWRVPLQYIFNADSATPIPCTADSLQTCVLQNANTIDALQRIKQVNAARWQSAVYLDSLYKLPLNKFKKAYFVFKNKGEYYFNSGDDTQVLTKYDYTMSNGFSLPIYRNLSVEPTVDLFWYENKVALNGLFKVNYSIKLNYTVDWGVNRMRFKEATKNTPFGQQPGSNK
jgi:hypothetical protein